MGIDITQWRVAIGSWQRGLHLVVGDKGKPLPNVNFMFKLTVVAMLLVIAGVETNPGPQETTIVRSHYKKRSGSANMAGELFEVKMSALLFLRAMNSNQQFQVASNMDAAGCFDDIVLKLGPCTTFLQLKHRERNQCKIYKSQLIQLKGDFSLLKYCKSYQEIKQQWEKDKDLKLFGKIEDSLFIVYTNAVMAQGMGSEVDSSEMQHIVNSGGKCLRFTQQKDGDIYKVFENFSHYRQLLSDAVNSDESLNTPELLEVIQKLYNNSAKTVPGKAELNKLLKEMASLGDLSGYCEFLSQMWFCTEQASEKQLGSFVRQEIEGVCGTDTVFDGFLTGIQDWWRNSNFYLSNKTDFWENIMQTCATSVTQSKFEQINNLNLKFTEAVCLNVRESLSSKEQVLHIKTSCSNLTCLKVLQSLNTNLVTDINILKNRLSEVLAVWRIGIWGDILVVEGWLDFYATYIGVLDVLNWNKNKRLLVVSEDLDLQFCEEFEVCVGSDFFSFCQLDQASQERILDLQVMFQGFPVKLRSITNEAALEDAINANVIMQFLSNDQTLSIGIKSEDLDPNYVTRSFFRKECLRREIFHDKNMLLGITGLSKHETEQLVPPGEMVEEFNGMANLKKNCRYLIINGNSDFYVLSKFFDNIHWIHWFGEGFFWISSKGNLTPLKEYLELSTVTYKEIEKVLNLPHQVVLLIGEAGIGKSTELSYVYFLQKQFDPSTWVVRINLNDYTLYLGQAQPTAIELLIEAGHFNSTFERKLFEYQIENGGKISLLFDGFDEISPRYTDKVMNILKDLLHKNIRNIWVTSRPMMKDILEKELCVLPFGLNPFTNEDQVKFLLKFWNMAGNGTYDLNKFVQELLKLARNSLNDNLMKFTGIPLQTKMLAEVFKAEAFNYCNTGDIKLPLNLDLLNLYIRFIDMKWEVYYEKMNVDITKVGVAEDYDEMKQMFQQNLMNCALVALLDEDQITMLHNPKQIIKRNQESVRKFQAVQDRRGIVVDVINEKAIFIHQTFAEYFAAVWFSENFSYNLNCFKGIYVSRKFQIIRTFFDRILAKSFYLHTTVLNHDKGLIEEILKKDDANDRDEGGRTALHLAISNFIDNNFEEDTHLSTTFSGIIRILLENGADPGIEDNVLCWRPLRLAEEIRAWSAVGLLLEKQADITDLTLIPQNIENDSFVQDVLTVAAKEGFVNLIAYMLKYGVDIELYLENRNSMLHFAAKYGHLKLVQFLIDNKADIEASNKFKTTPLIMAAENGFTDIAKLFIAKGCGQEASDVNGENAFLNACENGHYDVMRLLYDNNSDVSAIGNSALHLAARSGNLDCVKFLVDSGININCRNEAGETPLMLAIIEGSEQMAEFLLRHGADINIKDEHGNSLLHQAIFFRDDEDLVNLLLNSGLDIESKNNNGETALINSFSWGATKVKELLIKRGARLDALDENGSSVLHFAAGKCNVDLVNWLLDRGQDVDFRNKKGETPLMWACKRHATMMAQLLIQRGSNAQAVDLDDNTPLHFATNNNDIAFMDTLLNSNVVVDYRNKKGETPLMLACSRCTIDIVKLLIKQGAHIQATDKFGNSVLHFSVKNNDLHIIDWLLSCGIDINCTNQQGDTPLMLAVKRGAEHLADSLIKRGAFVNAKNYAGNTILHYAAGRLNTSTSFINDLINYGLHVDVRNKLGVTPLIEAVNVGATEVAQLLIRQGAKTDCEDTDGNSVMHYAVSVDKVNIIKCLLDCGLDIDCRNNKGQTPLMQACREGSIQIAELLVKRGAKPNAADVEGNSLLHFAIEADNIKLIKRLLTIEQDVDIRNLKGETPLMCAVRHDSVNVAKLLIKHGATLNAVDVDGNAVLHHAVMAEEIKLVKQLLDNGVDIGCRNKNDETPLMWAVRDGELKTMKFLLKQGANPNVIDAEGNTVLHIASGQDEIKKVSLLLNCGLDIDSINKNGETPLMWAIRNGEIEIADFLIRQGAKTDTKDKDENTILHYATLTSYMECIEYVLGCGIDVDSRKMSGVTPLMLAAKTGSVPVVEFFIQRGASIQLRDDDGDSILHYSAYSGNLECLIFVIQSGLEIDCINNSGVTPLVVAAERGLLDCVKLLIDLGANVNVCNNDGDNVLLYSVYSGNVECVKHLLQCELDINYKNKKGLTPLLCAAVEGVTEVIEFLIQQGADTDATDKNGDTLLHYAAYNNNVENMKLALNCGLDIDSTNNSGVTALMISARAGTIDVLVFLVQQGANINACDEDGTSVLHCGAYSGSIECVKYFIGCGLNVECVNKLGVTPLMYAAEEGTVEIVKFLVLAGANMDIIEEDGDTVLHHAAYSCNVECVKHVLDCGLTVDAKNSNHETPLWAAARLGKLEVVQLLMEHGADMHVSDKNGFSVLQVANREGHIDIVEFLTRHE